MIHYILQTSSNYLSDASYNRVRLFIKAFKENKTSVSLFKITISPSYGWTKKICFLIKNTFLLLLLLLKVSKKDIIIIYGETYFTFLYPLFSIKTNLIIERTEYPSHIIDTNISKRGFKNSLKNEKSYHYADMMIVCSSYLKNYYAKYVDDIFISPLSVDINEFSSQFANNDIKKIGEYIAYCGSFGNNKDGLNLLLEAFSQFNKLYPKVKLVLIGSGENDTVLKLKTHIQELEIANKVIFTGRLPHNQVGSWLCNACMLALARPNNKQAEGGIPSKVGEYLSSGVPCIITKVGDLPIYLKDGYDCFISDPDSSNAFFIKMVECYKSNKNVIAENAKKTVKLFDYKYQADLLFFKLSKKYNL